MESQQTTSNTLKQLRISRGLTQKQVAQKLCTDRTTYNKWENKKTALTIETFKRFVKELELSDQEVKMVLGYEASSPNDKNIITAYEKTIF